MFDSLQIQQGVLVWISPENISKELRGRGQDHLVSGDLLLSFPADQSNVEKFLFVPEITECPADVLLKIIPFQAKFV